jgi:hypothetical protein
MFDIDHFHDGSYFRVAEPIGTDDFVDFRDL